MIGWTFQKELMHFWYMSKDDAISIMESPDLNEKSGLL